MATEAAAHHPSRSRFWALPFLSGGWDAPIHSHTQSCSMSYVQSAPRLGALGRKRAAEQNICSCFWQTPARVTAGKQVLKAAGLISEVGFFCLKISKGHTALPKGES